MILLLESLHPDAETRLEAEAPLVRVADPDQAPPDSAGVRAILTRGRGRIPDALLARCPDLEVIARAGAGLDNLDTKAAARRGIPVIHAPGVNASTVAEHTLALLLDLARGVSREARRVARGKWNEREHYAGEELGGMTLGIVGFGAVGERVAHLARAFEMRVLVAAHPGRPHDPSEGPERVPLHDLLPLVDALTLHLPDTPATRGFLGAEELARLRPGALLINTARGSLIDGAALRAALSAGSLAGFAADVLDVEPPAAGDVLFESDRVLVTPHVASLTAATYRRLCVFTADNVLRVLRGETPDARSVYRGHAS